MIRKISLLLIVALFLTTPVFSQDKVDIIALRNGINSGTITVTTSATKIPTTPLAGRRCIIIVNISTGTIYIGNSSVTTAIGYQLYTQQSLAIDAGEQIDIYGIAGSSLEVRYLEIR